MATRTSIDSPLRLRVALARAASIASGATLSLKDTSTLELPDQAGDLGELLGLDAHVDAVHRQQRQHRLLGWGVAGPLADAIDRAFDLASAGSDSGRSTSPASSESLLSKDPGTP